jgi:hypothetical protein
MLIDRKQDQDMTDLNQPGWNLVLPDGIMLGSCFSEDVPLQIQPLSWQINVSSGTPPAISIETHLDQESYFRLFPHFGEGRSIVSDPRSFLTPPLLRDFGPDWIELTCCPLEGIRTVLFCWIPGPDAICGEVVLENHSSETRELSIGINSLLRSMGHKSGMLPAEYGSRKILAGETDHLHLVTLSTGSPTLLEGAIPCFCHTFSLLPGDSGAVSWIAAISTSLIGATAKLDQLLPVNRQAEISRRKIAAQQGLSIITGDQGRDFLLAFSRIQAQRTFDQLSLQGNSPGGQKAQLSPLEGIMLLEALTPLDPTSIKRLAGMVFPDQESPGRQEWQRHTRHTHLPLAAEFVWRMQKAYDQGDELEQWLDRAEDYLHRGYEGGSDHGSVWAGPISFPALLDLLDPNQGGKASTAQLAGIHTDVEVPGFNALLSNELTRLREMRVSLGQESSIDPEGNKGRALAENIKTSWVAEIQAFLPRDRQSQAVIPGRLELPELKQGLNVIHKRLDPPSRIAACCPEYKAQPLYSTPVLILHGQDPAGDYRIERLCPTDVSPADRQLVGVSKTIFSRLDYLYLAGTGSEQPLIYCPPAGNENISCLLPLWCLDLGQDLVQTWVQDKIFHRDHYLSDTGLRSIPGPGESTVDQVWNLLVIEGLLRQGCSELAAGLLARMMDAKVEDLTRTGSICWDASPGSGLEKGSWLDVIIPAGILLQTAGIEIDSQGTLRFRADSLYPGPLRIHIREAEFRRSGKELIMQIPGEEEVVIRTEGTWCLALT